MNELLKPLSCREPELVLLDMQSVAAGQEGWLAFDVTSASNHWLVHPRSNLGIRLYVETEEGGGASHCPHFHQDHCITPPPPAVLASELFYYRNVISQLHSYICSGPAERAAETLVTQTETGPAHIFSLD